MNHASREAEHRAFFGWLESTIVERSVEVLLVAGDIFETMHPSAEALEVYYGFLARVRSLPTLRQIVVVGGNHDSPSRLDAPEAVLGALGIHVVGGWSSDTIERSVCAIRGASGEVELVIGAVPFVHEYRLGVRTAGRMPGDIELDLRREFTKLYSRVADACESVASGAPLLAIGHLTCSSADATDYRSAIHQAGRVGGFSPEIFDPRFRYVALGHIHRMMQVSAGDMNEPEVWYSGTPVPLNRREASSPRHVLLLDFDSSGATNVEPIEVPAAREIFVLDGQLDEVLSELCALSWESDLLPYVLATIHSEERVANVARRFDEALSTFPEECRPRLVHVRERVQRERQTRKERSDVDDRSLAELEPEQVFVRLYQSARETPITQELLTAFRSLLVENEPQVQTAVLSEDQDDLGLEGHS